MKPFPGLIPFLVLAAFFFQPAKAQTPAETSLIARFPEAMKQADEELTKKIETPRDVVICAFPCLSVAVPLAFISV